MFQTFVYIMKYTLTFAILLLSCALAIAAETEWKDIGGGQARMIATLSPETGRVTGGVEINLREGWKTYWRSPGDSGIPPQFDFSKSEGFIHGETFLPAPTHIIGSEASYVGYKKNVTFIFHGQPTGSTGKIELNLFLGVCEEICIPAQAQFEMPLSTLYQSDPETFVRLENASAKLPSTPSDAFKIQNINVTDANSLQISVKLPQSESAPQLFAEGPANWFIEPAKLLGHQDGMADFHLDLSHIPSGSDIAKTQLRYTIAAGGKSIEEIRGVK